MNYPVYKFLLPTSIVMLVVGFAILFLGWFPILGFGSNFGDNMLYLCVLLLLLGFVLFIASLIDRKIVFRRSQSDITEQQPKIIYQKKYRILSRIGWIAVIAVICLMGFIFGAGILMQITLFLP
ncbi:MAG: hypothetical protein JW740_02170 [Candidatus Zambryskibacteria bacterium]|nr:hypothetical protein [Candidatus Zambryskibacteria bacterium]